MQSHELESELESVVRATDLLERLEEAADGGPIVQVGQYEASTLLALLTNKKYRTHAMSHLDALTQ